MNSDLSQSLSPRILNLILYSPSPVYDQMRLSIHEYMKTTQIFFFFYCFRPDMTAPYLIEDNMLYLKGAETYLPGILEKTILAIETCLSLFADFDYIVRTNISTVCNIFLLHRSLKNNTFDYGGSKMLTLSWIDPMSGITNDRLHGLNYISGTGIILSRKACNLLCAKQNELDKSVIDDVSIGLFFQRKGIPITCFENLGYPFSINSSHIENNVVFYRNNTQRRLYDIRTIKAVSEKLKNFPIEFADYGTSKKRISVLNMINKLATYFTDQGILIPQNFVLNSLRGDPHSNHQKYLRIKLFGKRNTYIVHEIRTSGILIPYI